MRIYLQFIATFCAWSLVIKSTAQTINISGNSIYEFNTKIKTDSILIPLRLDNIKLNDIQFTGRTPFSVRIGNMSTERFANALTFTAVDNPPHLSLAIDVPKLDIAGTYEIIIEYSVVSQNKKGFLSFSLNKPPATLNVNSVQITSIGDELKTDQLLLQETSGKGSVSQLEFSQLFVPGVSKGQLITIPSVNTSIPSGTQMVIPFTVDGCLIEDLPLGKTVGKMQILSKSLSLPVEVQFEIWRKRSSRWIIASILSGLLVSYLIKHFLKNGRDYELARLNAVDFIRDIRLYTQDIEDVDIKSGVANIILSIQNELDNQQIFSKESATDRVNKVLTESKNTYDSIKSKFQLELSTQVASYQEISKWFSATELEKPIQRMLIRSLEILKQAQDNLNLGNPKETAILLHRVPSELANATAKYTKYLKTLLLLFDDRAKYLPTVVTDATYSSLRGRITELEKDLDLLSNGTVASAESISQLNKLQIGIRDFVENVEKLTKNEFEAIDNKSVLQPEFRESFYQWVSSLAVIVNNEDKVDNVSLYWSGTSLLQLNEVWNTLQTKPENRNLFIAYDKFIFTSSSSKNLIDSPSLLSVGDVISVPDISEINRSYLTLSARYKFYSIVQSLLLLAIICLGVFTSYSSSFVGFTSEIINIFLFSFSLDLTIEGLGRLRSTS